MKHTNAYVIQIKEMNSSDENNPWMIYENNNFKTGFP